MLSDFNSNNIHIGEVTGAVGLKGEVKIFHLADNPELLKQYDKLIIDNDIYEVESIRYKKKIPILKFYGIDDRNAAELLHKKNIYIKSDSIKELPKDNYYIKDLVGSDVMDNTTEEKIGVLSDVITGTAQDTYEIKTIDGKTLLIPAISHFIIDIDIKNKSIKVELPEGIEEIKY